MEFFPVAEDTIQKPLLIVVILSMGAAKLSKAKEIKRLVLMMVKRGTLNNA